MVFSYPNFGQVTVTDFSEFCRQKEQMFKFYKVLNFKVKKKMITRYKRLLDYLAC